MPRVQVNEPSPQQQFEATPIGDLPKSDEFQGTPHFHIVIPKSVLSSRQQQHKTKQIFSLLLISFLLSSLNWCSRSLPSEGILCSWKNCLNDNLQTGLLRSSLFLAQWYKNPQSKKKTTKKTIGRKHKLHPLHEARNKHYVMLRLVPVTIGRANSTKSSMRTGHAPSSS